jgi:uncharacterized membrane protein
LIYFDGRKGYCYETFAPLSLWGDALQSFQQGDNRMKNNSLLKKEQRYQLALFGILAMSSIISIGLFAARATTSESGRYAFLVWNLFLAWIPYEFAWIAYISTRLPNAIRVVLVGMCAVLWLIFFPNAPYILTDFQHLAKLNAEAPVWYDVIMLLWFAWNGLFLGVISLYFMQKVVARWLGGISSWVFVVGVTVLSSLGVYVGRFMRWNSWDVMLDPFSMPGEFLHTFSRTQERTLTFSFLFGLFFLFVYVTLFIFGRLMNEHGSQG